MTLINRYPAISDLEEKARRRTPHFAWEYLTSGTGREELIRRNIDALQAIEMTPEVLPGKLRPATKVELFGRTYDLPFGSAPVGMSGLMWPGAEKILARAAAKHNFVFCLSTVACESPETVAEIAGENAWFQLYPTRDQNTQKDLIRRAKEAGIRTVLLTVDVPVGSRRERQLRAGLAMPPRMTAKTLWRVACRPSWAFATLAYGKPRFRALEPYFSNSSNAGAMRSPADFVDGLQGWEFVEQMRDAWDGNLIVKGILRPEEAERSIAIGADGVVVSNHGGRQFDGAPASIDVLPEIVAAAGGRTKILFDSGLRGGLDIARALALGADFCLLGRPFLYAAAALGELGGDHAAEILKLDLVNAMIQLGAKDIADLRRYAPASTKAGR